MVLGVGEWREVEPPLRLSETWTQSRLDMPAVEMVVLLSRYLPLNRSRWRAKGVPSFSCMACLTCRELADKVVSIVIVLPEMEWTKSWIWSGRVVTGSEWLNVGGESLWATL